MGFDVSSDFGIESALSAEEQRAKKDDEVGRTDFLTMLVAQLENQDPLNPQDASEFSAQLAQFSSLEQLIDMKASLDKLVETQTEQNEKRDALGEDMMATSLIDKEVAVFDNRLQVPEQGETSQVSFYLDGVASTVEIRVHDETGNQLYSFEAENEDGSWGEGLNTYDWTRPVGAEDYVWGTRNPTFSVVASRGQDEVRAEGVSLGRVTSTSMGFDQTLLELADGRRVGLENIFEVRPTTEGGI
ncbi:MAG: flagellar hook capping FlgD N-terminal domain-containing protein [Myxococcota bacterium]|jgi:flagellar basal-body rod modification protein FlgD|nr:flagellar hook capping FlgD N-terminal domain-containing protein [Myxococcota bacterium]